MYVLWPVSWWVPYKGTYKYTVELKDECSHFVLCKLLVLFDFLQSLLCFLAVLDEREVLLLQLSEDLHQLLRVTEVQFNLLHTRAHT